jgi:hypothetical protein
MSDDQIEDTKDATTTEGDTESASGETGTEVPLGGEETNMSNGGDTSITSITQRSDTRPILFQTISLFGVIGGAYAVFGFLAVDSIGAGDVLSAALQGFAAIAIILFAALIGPILGALLGLRTDEMLDEIRDDMAFATGGAGAATGQFILMIFTAIGALQSINDATLTDFIDVIIFSTLITGIVGALVIYVVRKS